MLRRPPSILWRMLTGETLRQLLLSALVIITVITFAATLRPVAEGRLGPVDALRFMGYASLPMLQFALPFAAAFAATLTFHRFGADNDALAASTGGVGYPAILAPALATGLVLAAVLGLMTNEIIPGFKRSMKEVVARDIARTVIASLERGESVQLNNLFATSDRLQDLIISADRTYTLDPDPVSGVTSRFLLEGVVAVALGDDGMIDFDITAQRADLRLYAGASDASGRPATLVTMTLLSAVGRQEGRGLFEERAAELGPWVVPDALSEDPDFYTFKGLQQLRQKPDPISGVDRARRALLAEIALGAAVRELTALASQQRRITLVDDLGQRFSITTRALRPEGARFAVLPEERAGGVEVTRLLEGGALRRQIAAQAWLAVDIDDRAGATGVRLELQDVLTPDAEQATRVRLVYDKLRLTNDPAPDYFLLDADDALAAARAIVAAAPATERHTVEPVRAAADHLLDRMERVRRDISGVQHARFALPAACLVMTMLGAVVGLRLHDSLPLPVYLWCFFPALLSVISVSGGASVAKENVPLGVAITWAGVAALALVTLTSYIKLRRH